MTDNPDMTYYPIEPPMPSAEELQAYADYQRSLIPNYELLSILNEVMWAVAFAQARVELWRTRPELRPFLKHHFRGRWSPPCD
jgi:hypothetical protein